MPYDLVLVVNCISISQIYLHQMRRMNQFFFPKVTIMDKTPKYFSQQFLKHLLYCNHFPWYFYKNII